MSKKIEKMRWAAEDKIYRRDEWIRQDNEELLMLEKRLNDLDLSERDRKVVDDYAACMESKQDRMGYLLYEAGMKDAKRRIRIRKMIGRLSIAAVAVTILVFWHEKILNQVRHRLESVYDSKLHKRIYRSDKKSGITLVNVTKVIPFFD